VSEQPVTMKLRRPVSLKKGAEPSSVLTLKPEGRALHGVMLSIGWRNGNTEKVFQRWSVSPLACAGLRMAGCTADRCKAVFGEMHSSDAFELFGIVRDMLSVSGETPDEETPETAQASEMVKIKLRRPVQFGKTLEPVETITLEPTGSALRDLDMLVSQEGDFALMNAEITELAKVGVRLGKVPGDMAIVDLMHPADVMEVAQAVLGFIQGGPPAGSDTSGS
jgi:hypothetical protein